jgi:translation initiation factor IF-1
VQNKKPRPSNNNKRRGPKTIKETDDKIYFDNGVVTETLPGTIFKIKVERNSTLDPIFLVCGLKTKLIRNVKIIRGDKVKVEVNPVDMYFKQDEGILKGTIIQRY